MPELQRADFGAGCFWGVEATFRQVPGVVDVTCGYAGGAMANPTYRDVCTGRTGHAEVVQVLYDPAKVSYQQLLEVFFENHDPTTLNSQGPDHGSQYRSVIFYHDTQQHELAQQEKQRRDTSGEYVGPIVTAIEPAATFYLAEDYHQRYFEARGISANCHLSNGKKTPAATGQVADAPIPVISPEKRPKKSPAIPTTTARNPPPDCGADAASTCGSNHWKSRTDAEWKKILTPEQYGIARQAGTERAFTGMYWNTKTPGIYRCACCGQDLFNSETKFDSGTGWPSFYAPVASEVVVEIPDDAHGMARTEVLCSRCEGHLGHVFADGPAPTHRRYCMNSAALKLIPHAADQ